MKSIKRPSQSELDSMSHGEKNVLILKLFDRLEELESRVKKHENKPSKDSQNSSKPPSTDGLRKEAAEPR
jgi:transposase